MVRDRCPHCSQYDLLIYGGFKSPISCGVCESRKNPERVAKRNAEEWERVKTVLETYIEETLKARKK